MDTTIVLQRSPNCNGKETLFYSELGRGRVVDSDGDVSWTRTGTCRGLGLGRGPDPEKARRAERRVRRGGGHGGAGVTASGVMRGLRTAR
jgi:hypothetical protein